MSRKLKPDPHLRKNLIRRAANIPLREFAGGGADQRNAITPTNPTKMTRQQLAAQRFEAQWELDRLRMLIDRATAYSMSLAVKLRALDGAAEPADMKKALSEKDSLGDYIVREP